MASHPVPVKITLKTKITDQNFREQMDVSEKGKLYHKEDAVVLIYNERDEDGNPVRNMLTISPDKVVVKRTGHIKMNQIFREDYATESTYYHPFGMMHMETTTKKIDFVKGDNEGKLLINYSLRFNQQEPQTHQLTLTYERE